MDDQQTQFEQHRAREQTMKSLPFLRMFHKAEVVIDAPELLNLGDTFTAAVSLAPTAHAKVRQVLLELVCQEEAIVRGSSSTSYYHETLCEPRTLEGPTVLMAGQPYEYVERFAVPIQGPPTFMGRNHFIHWFLRLRLDVPWWPDTRAWHRFRVQPTLVGGARG